MADSREAVIAAAEKYIFEGIVNHNPDAVPFADDCVRRELGMITGQSGTELCELLRSEAYEPVTGAHNLRWVVEGEQAVVFYEQSVSFSADPLLVCTRFCVRGGLIGEIEILLYGKGLMDAIAAGVEALASGE